MSQVRPWFEEYHGVICSGSNAGPVVTIELASAASNPEGLTYFVEIRASCLMGLRKNYESLIPKRFVSRI